MYSFESDSDHIFLLANRLACQNLIDITACKVNTMKSMDWFLSQNTIGIFPISFNTFDEKLGMVI